MSVLLEPPAPVLQPLVERLLRVGRSRDVRNAAGRAVFTAVRMRTTHRGQLGAAERLPLGGEAIGIGEQIHRLLAVQLRGARSRRIFGRISARNAAIAKRL